ncbi:hypothetical protein BGX29_001293 [Mortierella sp. GBA35]|nr:hypothetical protein BGX29_001293 [Mortierella sp. GBA35]KAF9099903.1 hypothetical protein BGX23_009758 [Mortierella sp. AD031]KAG0198075.1 hypothetical protein BGX33_012596 [Mortierella sp. NVP41]
MYRHRVKKAPTPVFADTLAGMGYTINEERKLIDTEGKPYLFDLKAKNRAYQEAHGRALAEAAVKAIIKQMEDECDIVRKKIPFWIDDKDTTSPQASILMSKDAKECDRLLVLIPNTMEILGSWSRRLLCNETVDVGSMLSTVKIARAKGYGVLMLNPNAHWFVNGRASVDIPLKSDVPMVPTLGSPEEHVEYVLRNLVAPEIASKKLYFVAHKYGAHALLHNLYKHYDTFKDRVGGIALIEGVHSIDTYPDTLFQKWWSLNTVAYIQSEEAEKGQVEFRAHSGCNCYKTGTQQFDIAIMEGMPAIFEFFEVRKDRDNTFEMYKDLMLPRDERDPTTAIITFQDEAALDDSYASYANQDNAGDQEEEEELDMGGAKIVGEEL